MLVDDATVEVENIHRNHVMRKPLLVAILDGAHQIANAYAGRHAFYLHRLFPGRATERRGAVSFHTSGFVSCLRNADLLSAVADPRPNDGFLLTTQTAPGAKRQQRDWPFSQWIRGTFRAPAPWIRFCSLSIRRPSVDWLDCGCAGERRLDSADVSGWRRLFSEC